MIQTTYNRDSLSVSTGGLGGQPHIRQILSASSYLVFLLYVSIQPPHRTFSLTIYRQCQILGPIQRCYDGLTLSQLMFAPVCLI